MKTRNRNYAPKKKKLLLKVDDKVQVIAGKDKGAIGKILNIDRYRERVIVEGVNVVTKHIKPNQQNQEGRIEKFEAPIHYSNVLLYCDESKKGERIRIKINDDNTKTRVFVKSGISAD
jgi:large subunit ribosomal protein L24